MPHKVLAEGVVEMPWNVVEMEADLTTEVYALPPGSTHLAVVFSIAGEPQAFEIIIEGSMTGTGSWRPLGTTDQAEAADAIHRYGVEGVKFVRIRIDAFTAEGGEAPAETIRCWINLHRGGK